MFHDSLLKRADEAAATETEAVAMNKKSSPASSDDKILPRKASTADTFNDVSDGTATSMNSCEKKIYYCSSEGCINQVVQGGVCNRHGAKVKRCGSEGCTNIAKKRRSVL